MLIPPKRKNKINKWKNRTIKERSNSGLSQMKSFLFFFLTEEGKSIDYRKNKIKNRCLACIELRCTVFPCVNMSLQVNGTHNSYFIDLPFTTRKPHATPTLNIRNTNNTQHYSHQHTIHMQHHTVTHNAHAIHHRRRNTQHTTRNIYKPHATVCYVVVLRVGLL